MGLNFNNIEFMFSAAAPKQFPEDDFPHFSFAGKSNVGKSTLINLVTNRKKLAKTGSTPGKTRLINFFMVNDDFVISDLPGYGYAAGPVKEKLSWGPLIEKYLSTCRNLKMLFLLIDIRRGTQELDKQLLKFAEHYKIPYSIIATKCDKLKSGAKKKALKDLQNDFENINVIESSKLQRTGISEIHSVMEAKLKQ